VHRNNISTQTTKKEVVKTAKDKSSEITKETNTTEKSIQPSGVNKFIAMKLTEPTYIGTTI
jgi:hypothetical protein